MKALITKLFKKVKQNKEISTFKAARRALIAGVASLVVFVSMLTGTTFAWFTDSVTSGKNKIEAGYTDFDVKKYDFKSQAYSGVVDAETKVFSNVTWNPGDVGVAYYEIKNSGNLDIILNVDLVANAIKNPQEGIGDLSDFMVLKAVIQKDDFETKVSLSAVDEEALKALKAEAGINVGVKNFKSNLFPAEGADQAVVKPNEKVYVKVIAYLPSFDEATASKPLIFNGKSNKQVSNAKCEFSMTVNAFQVIEDVNITYKTFVWEDKATPNNKLALKQVPVAVNTANTIKASWKEVGSTEDTVYAFDQDSLQAALSTNNANVVLLNDIVVDNWETIDSFSGTIKSYSDKKFTIWGLNKSMINTFSGTIERVVFKNCNAPDPHVVITNESDEEKSIYNGILAAKTEGNAIIKNVDVLYSTIATTKEGVNPKASYIGALVGWMNKEATIEDCTATNNSVSEIVGVKEPQPENE